MVTRSAMVGALSWKFRTVPDAETASMVPARWTGMMVAAAPSVQVTPISTDEVLDADATRVPALKDDAAVAIEYEACVLVAPFVAVWISQLLAVAAVACPTSKSQAKLQFLASRGRVKERVLMV
jgi:hypothetical protein